MRSEGLISRREFGFRLGSGVAGMALLHAFSPELSAAPPLRENQRIRNTILVVLTGGMSQLDSFDYKPDVPSDIRGPFSPLRTKTGNAAFSSLFPSMAAIDDRFLLLRAMRAKEAGGHEAAYGNWLRFNNNQDHLITTKLVHGDSDAIPYANLMQEGTDIMKPEHFAHMNPAQALQIIWNGEKGRYESTIGMKEPNGILLEVEPGLAKKMMEDEVRRERETVARRLDLLHKQESMQLADCEPIASMQRHYALAEKLLFSNESLTSALGLGSGPSIFGHDPCGEAFNIAAHCADPDGMNVQVVALECGHWDFHSGLEKRMKERAPALDHALATLIEFYGDRINICIRGEFGRTPLPQKSTTDSPGRNHFPIHTCIMAGPTIRPGVYGTTTRSGENIIDGEISEEQFRDILFGMAGTPNPKTDVERFIKKQV